MNGDKRKIEIFKPFGEAFELTKKILFRPFEFKKWLVIGFAAFISGNWGGGGNFNTRGFREPKTGSAPLKFHFSDLGPWWTAGLIVAAVLLVVLIVILIWVSCRGRFIFADCVVRNRAAIVDPWYEYRREGNSYFFFSLAVFFISALIILLLALVILVPFGIWSHGTWHGGSHMGVGFVITMVCVALLWIGFAIFFAVVTHFMVLVMYRQRCRAVEAFVQVCRLVMNHLGSFVLLILFSLVLFLAFLVISTVVTCATCCLAGLPYVSSVVLLPALVCLMAFKLFFLRQFGNEYDVWEGNPPSLYLEPPPPPVPPVQA